MLASLPLLIGWSIDGLLNDDFYPFFWLIVTMALLLATGIFRRLLDTRAYGTMRVELGAAVAGNKKNRHLSATNAQVDMSGELIDFLETEAPLLLTAIIHAIYSIAFLLTFHAVLAATATTAILASLLIYLLFGRHIFQLNGALNNQSEKQVAVLERTKGQDFRDHLSLLRWHRVRLSDLEALVYGLIFALLLSMLGFNLWFATTQTDASPGQVFSIVVYSYEFIESAIMLPMALESLTRIAEITDRINCDQYPEPLQSIPRPDG